MMASSLALRLLFTIVAMVTNLVSGTRAAPFKKGRTLSLRASQLESNSARALAIHAAAMNNATKALAFLNKAPNCAQGASGAQGCPGEPNCMPVCKWQCSTPQCAEVCEPDCEAPRCDIRCTKKDDTGCNFNCAQPSCAVICPNKGCGATDCPKCNEVCGAPKSSMECQGLQPCHSVCEQPACKWNCRKPDVCPQPKCSMICESPKDCPSASAHVALPPVGSEYVVSSFNVPHVPAATPCGLADCSQWDGYHPYPPADQMTISG
jgi:hypothetical protein